MEDLFKDRRLILAPMAGVTDEVFRELCIEAGAQLTYTEMVSAKALSYGSGKTRDLLVLAPSEQQVAVQIFGHEPETMAQEAYELEQMLGHAVFSFDVNMGCPARKIAGKGDGAALMRDPLLDDATKVRVALELVSMAQYTVEGQALDIGWAKDGRYDLSLDDYFTMAIHKTAHYSGAVPLAVGAIVGGGSEEQIEGLRQFGLDTGLAFQIQDDVLNLVGTEEQTKKDFRNDITEGKRTLIVVHALSNSDERERLIEILSSRTKDPARLEEAVAIMERSGSIDYARDYAEELVNSAKERITTILDPSLSRDLLVSMADWFVERLQ